MCSGRLEKKKKVGDALEWAGIKRAALAVGIRQAVTHDRGLFCTLTPLVFTLESRFLLSV